MRPPLHFVIPSLLFPPSSPSSSPLYSSSSLCFFFSTPRPSFFHLVPRLYLCPFLLLFVPCLRSSPFFYSLSLDSPSSSPSAVSRFLFRSFHFTRAPGRVHLPLPLSFSFSPIRLISPFSSSAPKPLLLLLRSLSVTDIPPTND